jgi:hypothetical protein
MPKPSRCPYINIVYVFLFTAYFRLPSDAGRSESPYVGSENGAVSDDASPSVAKGKGKSKTKRVGKLVGFWVSWLSS